MGAGSDLVASKCADFVAFGAEIGRVVRGFPPGPAPGVAFVRASTNLDMRCDEIVASCGDGPPAASATGPAAAALDVIAARLQAHATIEP
jgi:hypothetical protein